MLFEKKTAQGSPVSPTQLYAFMQWKWMEWIIMDAPTQQV